MTRAKERLFLTRAEKRIQHGILKQLPVSPFLVNVEKELINASKFDKKIVRKDLSEQLSLF